MEFSRRRWSFLSHNSLCVLDCDDAFLLLLLLSSSSSSLRTPPRRRRRCCCFPLPSVEPLSPSLFDYTHPEKKRIILKSEVFILKTKEEEEEREKKKDKKRGPPLRVFCLGYEYRENKTLNIRSLSLSLSFFLSFRHFLPFVEDTLYTLIKVLSFPYRPRFVVWETRRDEPLLSRKPQHQ